jgi:hypothetical protein
MSGRSLSTEDYQAIDDRAAELRSLGLNPARAEQQARDEVAAVATRRGQASFRSSLTLTGRLTGDEKAHHIVEVRDSFARDSRDILDELGLSLNDPINGIGLRHHKGRHNQKYSAAVLSRIQGAEDLKDLRKRLEEVAMELRDVDDRLTKQIENGEREAGEADTIKEWASENE